jgi:diaminohydroxyphosphoribosylaminopyrimidine deaminase/5-amino-6-(5-phosphoribosylamino)uracil reductase
MATGARRAAAGADRRHLAMALDLARRAAGRTAPNPMVGAVLVRRGRVVGRGWHRRAGAPHAEIVALQEAGRHARGATLYINLEPCCHFGRTPPCVDALVAAGVTGVVASLRDPDPRVRGRGFRALRSAGVRVRVGTLRREAEALNEPYLRAVRTGLPFVTLKAGMSVDGRIATREGRSRWITSGPARAEARRLRARHDAVLVGVNTLLADDPRLTAAGGGPPPARVVLDARLRTPASCRLLRTAGGPVVLVTLPDASPARRRRLERAGALVVEAPGRDGRVSLRATLRALARRGVRSVLVEGGSEVLGGALDEGIGDAVALYVAPRILGGRQALPAFGGRGAGRLAEAPGLRDVRVRPVGRDWVIEARLGHRRRGGRRAVGREA